MPIQVTQYETKPAVNYDKVHVSELRIILTEGEGPAQAGVRIVYKLYGQDENGIKYFDKAQYVITIEDAYVEAMTRAQQGDMVLAQALGGIEAAVAALINQQGTHGTATVV